MGALLYHPGQDAFLNAIQQKNADGLPAFNRLLLLAGRRGGKSLVGALGVALFAAKPNQVIWACAPSFPKLHDYVLPALREALPAEWIVKWSEKHQEFTLRNGTVVQCRSLDEPARGRGPGLDALWIDEARDVPERAWQTLVPALVDKKGIAWVTSSPQGYDWVYRTFWKPAQDGVPGFWAIRYKTIENPAIDEHEIEAARASLEPEFARQEFDAEFVHFTGAVYGDRIDGQVITDGSESLVIPEWPHILSSRHTLCTIDPGVDHPFGAALAVMTDLGMVWIGEYLQRHQPISEHVRAIKQLVGTFQPQYGYDRSARQVAIELAQHGIIAAPCENAVEAGIRRVESWLFSGKMWFLASRVPMMIAQMRSYRWANNVSIDGQRRIKERVFKVDDELPDCFVRGTQIRTITGERAIEQIRLGDVVWTRQGWCPVEAVFRLPLEHPTTTLTLTNGRTLTGTGNHRIWIDTRSTPGHVAGWLELWQVQPGDSTCATDPPVDGEGGHQRAPPSAVVVTHVTAGAIAPVYNLTVSVAHEYVANGVLVANCVRYAAMLHPEIPEAQASTAGRDISNFPEDVQVAIVRERRLTAWVPELEHGLGDFYRW